MANVTLAVDAEVLRRARVVARDRGTTLNGLVRRHLEALAAAPEDWFERFDKQLALVAAITAEACADGRPIESFSRNSLHDERMSETGRR